MQRCAFNHNFKCRDVLLSRNHYFSLCPIDIDKEILIIYFGQYSLEGIVHIVSASLRHNQPKQNRPT